MNALPGGSQQGRGAARIWRLSRPRGVPDERIGRDPWPCATIDLRSADDERFPEGLISKSEALLYHDDGGEWRLEIGGDVLGGRGRRSTRPRHPPSNRHPRPAPVGLAGAGHPTRRRGRRPRRPRPHPRPGARVPAALVGTSQWRSVSTIGSWTTCASGSADRSPSRELCSGRGAHAAAPPTRRPPEPFSPARRRLIPAGDRVPASWRRIRGGRTAPVGRSSSGDPGRHGTTEARGDERRPIHLVTAPIRFCDVTVAGEFRGMARPSSIASSPRRTAISGCGRQTTTRSARAVLRRAREFGWVRLLPRRAARRRRLPLPRQPR